MQNALKIPRLESKSATLAALVATRAELAAKLGDLNAEAQRLGDEARTQAVSGIAEVYQDNSSEIETARILGRAAPEPNLRRVDQIANLRRQADVVARAVAALDGEILEAKRSASRAVCDELRPIYRQRMSALCGAVISAQQAAMSIQVFERDLESAGVGLGSLRAGLIDPLGAPDDAHSNAAIFLREAAKGSYVSPKDIPAELRQ